MRTSLVPVVGGLARPFSLYLLLSLSRQPLLLPVYHLSSDEPLPHIRHIYPIRNARLFREDMDFFLRHYEPVDIPRLIAHVSGENPIRKPSFFLSFDDGLREIYDVVAPILREKGIPAAFFINSDFVDNRGLFFRYKASLLADTVNDPARAAAFMQVKYDEQHILDEAAQRLEIDFDQFLNTQKPYLSTEQIRSLIHDGFTIGAHSADHPEYRFIPLEAQLGQTSKSLACLRESFSLKENIFAFPFTDFGVGRKFFEEIYSKDNVSLSFGCAGLKTDIFPQHLQRLPMEGTLLPAQKIVKAEYLYYLAKMPMGKNRIIRY
ncbi:MAG: polysaccharide deacetylase family protein [Bacteroidia bacterium]